MLPGTSQWIALREHYRVLAQRCEQQRSTLEGEQRAFLVKEHQLFVMAARKLSSLHPAMEPVRVYLLVGALLTWLVDQKVGWMCGQRRRRSSPQRCLVCHSEQIIAQIDQLLLQVSNLCSPDWKASSLQQGFAFQVFHRRDLMQLSAIALVRQQWRSPARDQWYQEVAIVRVKHSWRQLSEVFRVTNHIDQPWPRNREVVWSLDMHAYQQPSCASAEPTGPHYPRSTSIGDVIVSLLTGAAWVVAPVGFLALAVADGDQGDAE